MLYVYLIVISLLIGLLRKGKLSNLSMISIKRIELIILASIIQAGLIFFGLKRANFIQNYSAYALIFSYILLFFLAIAFSFLSTLRASL